jgi:hypothetical protein
MIECEKVIRQELIEDIHIVVWKYVGTSLYH